MHTAGIVVGACSAMLRDSQCVRMTFRMTLPSFLVNNRESSTVSSQGLGPGEICGPLRERWSAQCWERVGGAAVGTSKSTVPSTVTRWTAGQTRPVQMVSRPVSVEAPENVEHARLEVGSAEVM